VKLGEVKRKNNKTSVDLAKHYKLAFEGFVGINMCLYIQNGGKFFAENSGRRGKYGRMRENESIIYLSQQLGIGERSSLNRKIDMDTSTFIQNVQ